MSSTAKLTGDLATGKKRSRLRKTSISVLSHAYSLAAEIAEDRIDSGSKRGAAAGAAATILAMGLDKMQEETGGSKTASILDIDAEPFDSDMSYDDDESSRSSRSSRSSSFSDSSVNGSSEHFIDRLLEKLLVHAIPRKEREVLSMKLHDPVRTKKPNLSIRIMLKNFRKLSSKMNGLFALQYGIIHLLSWRNPAVTLTLLLIYTSICIYPHLVLVYPLLYILFGQMVPSYTHRHPLKLAELRAMKPNGKSVLDFLSTSPDSPSLLKDALGDPEPETVLDADLKSDPTSAKSLKNQMELLINMRDLQNLTSEVIILLDRLERFWYGTAGFTDERVSTSLFLFLLQMVIVILVFGVYIPWRPIFILLGWALVAACHPKASEILKKINEVQLKPQRKKMDKSIQKSEIKDIILDEPPVLKDVEIFELEEQGWTPSQWTPYCFTDEVFDKLARQLGKPPVGCSTLDDVLPPATWKFKEEKSWEVDKDCESFEGRSDMRLLGEDGWLYDMENGELGRWRRRRWVRTCYRYARPPKRTVH